MDPQSGRLKERQDIAELVNHPAILPPDRSGQLVARQQVAAVSASGRRARALVARLDGVSASRSAVSCAGCGHREHFDEVTEFRHRADERSGPSLLVARVQADINVGRASVETGPRANRELAADGDVAVSDHDAFVRCPFPAPR